MKLNIFKLRLQKKILIAFTLIVIIPVILTLFFSYLLAENIIIEKNNKANINYLTQINNTLVNIIDRMSLIATMLSQNIEMKRVLTETEEYSTINYLKILKIFENTRVVSLVSDLDISVISFNNYIYSTLPHSWFDYTAMSNSYWFKEIIENDPFYTWKLLGGNFILRDDYRYLCLGKLIYSLDNIPVGILIVSIQEDVVLNRVLANNTLGEEKIFIFDSKGTIAINNDSPRMLTDTLAEHLKYFDNKNSENIDVDGQKWLINIFDIKRTDWKLLRAVPYGQVIAEISNLRIFVIIITVLFLLLFLFGTYGIIKKYTSPIHHLINVTEKIREGDMDVRTEIFNNDEIGELSKAFNFMLDRINSLIKEKYEKQEMLHKAQIIEKDFRYKILQSKVNPHFLFNTLNNIKWMAIINNASNVAEMLSALGTLLENSLGKKGEIVRVKEEIKCIEDYSKIQKMAYGNKFNIVINIEEKILECSIIKFILQPIIENAIIHGINPKDEGGLIKVNGTKNGDNIVFTIEDNGVGMDKRVLDNFHKEIEGDGNKLSFYHLGLKVTRERIKLFYGECYGIIIDSWKNKGTIVTINIPYCTGIKQNV